MVDIMNNVFKIFLQKSYLKIEKVGQLKAGLIPWYLELMWILSLHIKQELDVNLEKKPLQLKTLFKT